MGTTLSLSDAIKKARKQTLDILEAAYGDTPEWQLVRSRILRIFGRDGLEQFTNGQEHSTECQNGEANGDRVQP